MKINKHNLTIAEHCASKELSGYLTNGLQFNKTGTVAINRCYSVSVSALEVAPGEPTGCITPTAAASMAENLIDGILDVDVKALPLMKGTAPIIKLPANPVQFEMTLSANFLVKLAQSARDFTGPEDAIVRIQFTGASDPVRLDARNTTTGQKWEALVMPRQRGSDIERFTERAPVPPPPPPPAEPANDFDAAMAAAQKLMGM